MKKTFIVILLSAIFVLGFADEAIDWNGITSGSDCYPKWLASLEKGNEKPACKKLLIEKNEELIFKTAVNTNLEMARAQAKKEVMNVLAKENEAVSLNGLDCVYDHWILFEGDDGEYYKAFIIYVK